MKPALLDVNLLIALLDPQHEFHDPAHKWFAQNRLYGWATCPITENACLRILAKPGYPYMGLSVNDIRGILSEFCSSKDHLFWPHSVSLLESKRFDLSVAGPKNVTDLYLLGVAEQQGGRLATFDRNIRWQSVAGANAATLYVIIPPLDVIIPPPGM